MDSDLFLTVCNLVYIQSRNAVIRSWDLPEGWLHGLRKPFSKYQIKYCNRKFKVNAIIYFTFSIAVSVAVLLF